jgi:hypothetical protein
VGEGELLERQVGLQVLVATTPTTVRRFILDGARSMLLTYVQSPTMDHPRLLGLRAREELPLQLQALL